MIRPSAVKLAEVGKVDHYPQAFDPEIGLRLSAALLRGHYPKLVETATVPEGIPIRLGDPYGWESTRNYKQIIAKDEKRRLQRRIQSLQQTVDDLGEGTTNIGGGFGFTVYHPGAETSWHSDGNSYILEEKFKRVVINLAGWGILQWLPYDNNDLPFGWVVDTTLPGEIRNLPMGPGDIAVIQGPAAHNAITLEQIRTIAVCDFE